MAVNGRTVDGQPIDRVVTLEPGMIVSCSLVACLGPILAEIAGLEVGERRTLGVWTLTATTGSHGHPSGSPRFVAETWDVSRRADSSGVRAFEVTVEHLGLQRTLTVRLDASGLLDVSRPNGYRCYTVDRR